MKSDLPPHAISMSSKAMACVIGAGAMNECGASGSDVLIAAIKPSDAATTQSPGRRDTETIELVNV